MPLSIHIPIGSSDHIKIENFTCICNMCHASAKIELILHYPSWNVIGAKITCGSCESTEESNYAC